MRMRWMAAALLALGCGGATGNGTHQDGGMNQAPDLAMAMVPKVPDPGSGEVVTDWPDTEPNDTPDKAVPLGTGSQNDVANGLYAWMGFNPPSMIGGADTADFYVFGSGPVTKLHLQPCWQSPQVNLLDYYLYKAVDGQPLAMIGSSTTTDVACETHADWTLEPNTRYVIEIRSVTGQGAYQS